MKKKKPIYKRVWFYIVVLIVGFYILGSIVGDTEEEVIEEKPEIDTGEDAEEVAAVEEDVELSEEESEPVETETTEEEADETADIQNQIESEAKTYIEDYNNTSIKDININEDLGNGEGYIALVYLSFDAKNTAGTSKDMIEMYSNDLGARLADNKDVNEVTVFWEVPYLHEGDNIAKYNMQRQGDGMAIKEEYFDPNIFE